MLQEVHLSPSCAIENMGKPFPGDMFYTNPIKLDYSLGTLHLNLMDHLFKAIALKLSSNSAKCPVLERVKICTYCGHRWKEEILSFPTMCHSCKSVTCIKFKGQATKRNEVRINRPTISPISIDRTMLKITLITLSTCFEAYHYSPDTDSRYNPQSSLLPANVAFAACY